MEIRQVCADYHNTAGGNSAPCIFTVHKSKLIDYLVFENVIKIPLLKNLLQGEAIFIRLFQRNPTADLFFLYIFFLSEPPVLNALRLFISPPDSSGVYAAGRDPVGMDGMGSSRG